MSQRRDQPPSADGQDPDILSIDDNDTELLLNVSSKTSPPEHCTSYRSLSTTCLASSLSKVVPRSGGGLDILFASERPPRCSVKFMLRRPLAGGRGKEAAILVAVAIIVMAAAPPLVPQATLGYT
jgi:hypothetical protein